MPASPSPLPLNRAPVTAHRFTTYRSRSPIPSPQHPIPSQSPLPPDRSALPMVVHLLDGTYELFRHFYGQRRFNQGKDKPLGAVAGVLHTVLEMIEGGARYLGVATDHVIESFRNEIWADYKTGEGIERALAAQFHPLEEALTAMGVVVWPMVELE